ncbi:MAG: Mrp/NBP35 family ATP-binding protein [Desulfobacterales bacterium]|nr:Mrp/NBP35 family ATP-binding protein [Desulfobacterales bacterium]MDD4463735.1 Mrp/NBP35 family ATP-binding protein [Desulfobacterales bacterium]
MDQKKAPKTLEEEISKSSQEAALKGSLKKIRQKFLVMSGKGGVGKTSVSINLALALSRKGFKVGIIDVDIHGPDVPRMLGLDGILTVNEKNRVIPMPYSDNLSVISIESMMPSKDEAIIWRGPMKHAAIRQFIGDVEWGDLDFLIIDSPPGTGDEPLTVAQTIPEAKAIIVTTPQEVSLADVRKSINFCKNVGLDIFGLVENMSGFTCPHCGESFDLFGSGGGQRTADETGISFLGRIPFDMNMVACSDTGVSFQEKYVDSPVTQAFDQIADKMAGEL